MTEEISHVEEKMEQTTDLAVFITTNESWCTECKQDLGRKAWITLTKDRRAVCLECADLAHLVFLPSGDPALTRRARKCSNLSVIVLKWNRARKRYERQGILVEEKALEKAEQECLTDVEARLLRREREAERCNELDREYVQRFTERILGLFPRCPKGIEQIVAEHACLKYSGRIGRSASAKNLDEDAVRLAVIAYLCHTETEYDTLLSRGYERWEARGLVNDGAPRVDTRGSNRCAPTGRHPERALILGFTPGVFSRRDKVSRLLAEWEWL